MQQQHEPSERQRALFDLGTAAVVLVREGAIRHEDLTAIAAVLTALIEAEGQEGRP